MVLRAPSCVNDLGVEVDSHLTFHNHIMTIVTKARKRCALFLKFFLNRDPVLMLKFFVTFVRPLLEYASPVWSPCSSADINLLEGVQRYFTNKIPGCRFLSYQLRLEKLSLHSLHHRRIIADLVLLHASVLGTSVLSLSPHLVFHQPASTRGLHFKIELPILKYSKSRQNYITRSAPLWNGIVMNLGEFSPGLIRKKTLCIGYRSIYY